jgi:hypothetical protein
VHLLLDVKNSHSHEHSHRLTKRFVESLCYATKLTTEFECGFGSILPRCMPQFHGEIY